MNKMRDIGGILFDLDGVLYIGDRVIEGAADTIQHVRQQRIPHCFVTNTTTRSRESLSRKLHEMGLAIDPEDILSAPAAACIHLHKRRPRSCWLVVSEEVRDEFREFRTSRTNPEVVVIGDIGSRWTYELMNRIFRLLMDGAELIALHKGKFWESPEGLRMDIGAFIAGLEYVAGVQATVIGKPAPAFFRAAAEQLGRPEEEIVMVGDDIDSDIGGAQRCGIRGILVRTGKYRKAHADASPVTPDAIIDSVADLTQYL